MKSDLGEPGVIVLRDVSASAVPAMRRALAPLGGLDHPNVARHVDVQAVEGRAAVRFEPVEGPTLAQALEDAPFTAEQADDLGRGILTGLQAIHEAGFTHPRIGPDDVLLSVGTAGPVPRIVGAGVVEAATGRRGDARDDVWAVGRLLHALVTGHVPRPDETLVEVGREVPERIASALVRAMRVDVDQRGQSAREVLAVWEGSGETSTARVAPARAWDERTVRRLRALAAPTTPAERTWDDLPTDPGPAPVPASRLPTLVLVTAIAVVGLMACWLAG